MASPASVRSIALPTSSSCPLRDRPRYGVSHSRSRLFSMSPMNSRVSTICPRSRTSASASRSLDRVCFRGAWAVKVSVVKRAWRRCCCSSHFSDAVSSASSAFSRSSSVVTLARCSSVSAAVTRVRNSALVAAILSRSSFRVMRSSLG